jgi:hypothetical protein
MLRSIFATPGLRDSPIPSHSRTIYGRERYKGVGFFTNRVLVAVLLAGTFAVFLVVADRMLKAGWSSQVDVAVAVTLALAIGALFQANYRRIVRLVDRLFLPRRYAASVALDRIAASLRGRGAAAPERVADDIGEALGLASVAIFTRTDDDGFVRRAAFGWPHGSAWHLLPGEPLTRELQGPAAVVMLGNAAGDELVFSEEHARPCVAVTLRRRSRVQSAILLGPGRDGGTPDADTVRGLAAVLAGVLAG